MNSCIELKRGFGVLGFWGFGVVYSEFVTKLIFNGSSFEILKDFLILQIDLENLS